MRPNHQIGAISARLSMVKLAMVAVDRTLPKVSDPAELRAARDALAALAEWRSILETDRDATAACNVIPFPVNFSGVVA